MEGGVLGRKGVEGEGSPSSSWGYVGSRCKGLAARPETPQT